MFSALRRLFWAAALASLVMSGAQAQQARPAAAPSQVDALSARLTPDAMQQLFPGVDKVVPAPGRPLALEAWVGGELKGYIFSTQDVVNAVGYTGSPFDFIAGMTLDGKITGALLRRHSETIIGRGVPQERLQQFIAGFASASLESWRSVNPDLLRGASISGRLLKNGMQTAAERVYVSHIKGEAFQVVTEPALDRRGFLSMTGEELLAKGSIVRIKLTVRDVLRLFEVHGGKGSLPSEPLQRVRSLDEPFVDYAVALATPASIGVNLFGENFASVAARQGAGLSIFMGAEGYFSFISNSHLSREAGYLFDQVKLVQGGKEFRFTRDNYQRASTLTSLRVPRLDTVVFYLPVDAGLDPLQPWQAVLMVPGKNAAGEAMTVEVPVTYNLPDIHKLLPPPPPRPAWVEQWEVQRVDIAILVALLAVVSLVFMLQDVLARSRIAYNVVRVGVLSFTLGWLGWWVGAQFSIINILSYLQAPFTDAALDSFLLDPLFFILGIYIAASLFLLGRGVFCGWLCPFGALQELSNKLALLLRVPQIKVPRVVQERLWVVKYVLAASILGIGLYSVEMANRIEEVEPFKTAINVYFVRELPFVLYAAALLAAGLFIERFYCRFLCPLGGALAVFGRVRMVKWLKRKPQCGTQCRICEADCPVGAIEPSGKINMNECLQCLDCQVDYYDDNKCPPLIARKKRKEARAEVGIGGLPNPLPAE
ncbi:MAG: 4Fe-4S binding protein [Alphaproteobacteria bacterium]|nr:4Fe-4S binding protein [Alphaproteobacteria bacterium]